MTESERILLVTMASVQVAKLAEERRNLPESELGKHVDIVTKLLTHKLLLITKVVCNEAGIPFVFTEEQMDDMLR